ncbi:hypothetical protein LXL04_003771 [Taraxacum kok-saghyz]
MAAHGGKFDRGWLSFWRMKVQFPGLKVRISEGYGIKLKLPLLSLDINNPQGHEPAVIAQFPVLSKRTNRPFEKKLLVARFPKTKPFAE